VKVIRHHVGGRFESKLPHSPLLEVRPSTPSSPSVVGCRAEDIHQKLYSHSRRFNSFRASWVMCAPLGALYLVESVCEQVPGGKYLP
jgi:hypothetical protein